MAQFEILLPAMGEGITEATITKWLVSEGDKVEEDDSIVEIATDKVDSEIPSPADGIVDKILFSEGDAPKVGEIIVLLKTEGDKEVQPKEAEEIETQPETEVQTVTKEETEETVTEIPGIDKLPQEAEPVKEMLASTIEGKFLSPLVRSIIEKENISPEELNKIAGTGKDGRVTKNDMLNYLDTVRVKKVIEPVKDDSGIQKPAPVPIIPGVDDVIIEMDRMQRLISDHMVNSKHTSPHVTSFHEVDVTNIVSWRNKIKDEFQKRENEKLTYTPIFFEAAAATLKELPMVNVSLDGYNIIVKKNINIGMATALPNGNLIVPVIKNADQRNLLGLSKTVNDLAKRSRENKLLPDEIQGGTFTITNLGTFGNITGSPIINQPQAAILALGAIVKKPSVIETADGDSIGIRHKMIISLSYDHRVVNGALGGMFLKKITDYLENFDLNRSI